MKATDPVVGTWKLNLAKSNFMNGPTPFTYKSATRVYTQGPDGITSKVTAVKDDGSPFSEQMTFKEDGKFYPHIANPMIDTMAVERVDEHTMALTAKKGIKVVGIGTRTISPDGKILRMTFVYTDAEGVLRGHVAAYDRQAE